MDAGRSSERFAQLRGKHWQEPVTVAQPNEREDSVEVTVVLPMHNEAQMAVQTLRLIEANLRQLTPSYEVIIAEDGSSDGTDQIASKLARDERIIHLHSNRRLGRGLALKRAFKKSRGKILVYMDSDLATNLKHLRRLIKAVLDQGGLVTGSRYVQGSRTKRPFVRQFASLAYNLIVRMLFKDSIHDHQCGFKAFSRTLMNNLLDEVQANGWFWDTEVIVRSKMSGHHVLEIPVEWVEPNMRKSKVNLLRDTIDMGLNAFKLWLTVDSRQRL